MAREMEDVPGALSAAGKGCRVMQGDLFSNERAARIDAIQRVDAHAPSDWKREADNAILYCAHQYETFTSDEVWIRLSENNIPFPPVRSALGPRFMQLAAMGIIKRTGERRKHSKFAHRHRELEIWRRAK